MPPEQDTNRRHPDSLEAEEGRSLLPSSSSGPNIPGTNVELESSSSCTVRHVDDTNNSIVPDVSTRQQPPPLDGTSCCSCTNESGCSSNVTTCPSSVETHRTGRDDNSGQMHAVAHEDGAAAAASMTASSPRNNIKGDKHDDDENDNGNPWQSDHMAATFNNNDDDVWSAAYDHDEEECKREISTEEFPITHQDPWAGEMGDHRVAVMAQQEEYDAQFAEYLGEEEDRLLALKLSEAYEGSNRDDDDDEEAATAATVVHANPSYDISAVPSAGLQQQEGTVVEIQQIVERVISTEYVQHNDEETIHAQWIGHEEYSNLIPASSQVNTDVAQNTVPEIAPTIAAVVHQDDSAQEATVIDSAPIEKQQHTFTEEAQVLPEQQETPSILDRKPPSSSRNSPRRSRRRRERNVEAEITSMQETEDIHPLERTDDGAQAELVGTVDSYTVAVPPISQTTAAAAESVEIAPTEGANTTSVSVPTPIAPEAQAIVATTRDESGEEDEVAIASAIMDDRIIHSQGGPLTEHAEVLLEHEVESEMDQKPAAVDRRNNYATIHENQSFQPATSASAQAEVIENQHGEEVHSFCEDGGDYADDGEVDTARCDQLTRSFDYQAQQVLEVVDAVHESLDVATQFTSLETNSGDILMASLGNSVQSICVEQSAAVVESQPFQHVNGQSCEDTQCSEADSIEEATDQSVVARAITVNLAKIVPLLQHGADEAFYEQADIVDVQQLEDLHPLVRDETISTSSMAELVGTTSLYDAPESQTSVHAPAVAEAMAEETAFSYRAEALGAVDDFNSEHQRGILVLEGREDPVNTILDALQPPEASGSPLDDDHSAEWLHVQIPDQGVNNHGGIGHSNASNTDTIDSTPKRTLTRTASANFQMLSNSIARGSCVAIEALFGSPSPTLVNRQHASDDEAVQAIVPRELLPWSVIYNNSTDTWITTIQTNQRALDSNSIAEASKSLRAFSMPTEKQALSLAHAWTPPRMAQFEKHKKCHICQSKFAILRRPCHCRNCGVCVCKDCTVQWPAIMIPETYNIKKEHHVNTCKSCNWLCNSFRRALLEGSRDQAVALAATGNINLHTPFANVKGELFYPVHCAVLGGNLDLLKFLVDENCSPVKSVRISGFTRDSGAKYTPIVTSRGRSLLGMAVETQNIHIVRYLVVEKNLSLLCEKDIGHEFLCRNLEIALRILPAEFSSLPFADSTDSNLSPPIMGGALDDVIPLAPSPPTHDGIKERTLSEKARDFGAIKACRTTARRDEETVSEADQSVFEECIICFDRAIDCVATPCGHQMCCLQCSENLTSRCPVCSAGCSFMRIFKP